MNDQKMTKQGEVKRHVESVIMNGEAILNKENKANNTQSVIPVNADNTRYMTKTQKQTIAEQKILEKRILANKLKVKKVVTSAKNSIDKTAKEVNNAVNSL